MRRFLDVFLLCALAIPLVRVALPDLLAKDAPREGPEWARRAELLARSQVFVPEALAAWRASAWVEQSAGPLHCTHVPEPASGSTPKFDCRLASGDVVKVKYGRTPERSGEVAATGLLAALGFGADRVEFVSELRCLGCPPAVFRTRLIADLFGAGRLVEALGDADRERVYEWVTVERKFPGRAVEIEGYKGWSWAELEQVSPAAGGATRAEVDALRLMAVLLAHWDNKDQNQRLTCLDADPECRTPILMLQDVGATFGPRKVTLEGWRRAPIWADGSSCLISMESFPHGGGSFTPTPISEAGRALLAARLQHLTADDMSRIFRRARMPDANGEPATDVGPWVEVLRSKIQAVVGHKACAGAGD